MHDLFRRIAPTVVLVALAAFIATAAQAASAPPVPPSAQAKIHDRAGAEAVVPTRLVSGMHYRFRISSFNTKMKTLSIRFADLRFAPGQRVLYFTVTPFKPGMANCSDGKQKTIQYDGNRVYWDGTNAWRCINGPKGTVKVSARGAKLPDVGLARVVASAKRIY